MTFTLSKDEWLQQISHAGRVREKTMIYSARPSDSLSGIAVSFWSTKDQQGEQCMSLFWGSAEPA